MRKWWIVQDGGVKGVYFDIGEGDKVIGQMKDRDDALLAKAAPDMKAALETFIAQWNACGPNSYFGRHFKNMRDTAVAALAKSEGK